MTRFQLNTDCSFYVKSAHMNPWECVGLSASLMLMIFCATIMGMVRHNVLQDPQTCCVENSNCQQTLFAQHAGYYDPVSGLRTRYITAMVIFFLVAALRTTSIPNHLELSLSKNVLVFLALFSYVTFVLFADTALHSFTSSPSNMLPQCSEISVLITDSVRVLSVFILVISFFLFYLFLITIPDLNEKNIIYYNSVNTKNAKNNGNDILDDEFGEDESEDLVFQTRL